MTGKDCAGIMSQLFSIPDRRIERVSKLLKYCYGLLPLNECLLVLSNPSKVDTLIHHRLSTFEISYFDGISSAYTALH